MRMIAAPTVTHSCHRMRCRRTSRKMPCSPNAAANASALVACFTHPGALALAAALGLQGIFRLVRKQRIFWHEWVTVGAAILLITAAALFWPVLIAQITGDPSGYFDTELGWWRQYLGRVIFVPFTPFFLL